VGARLSRVEREIILTLISDDNYSPLQRTLLMQFALIKPVLADPSAR
jgi:hypothetical protein